MTILSRTSNLPALLLGLTGVIIILISLSSCTLTRPKADVKWYAFNNQAYSFVCSEYIDDTAQEEITDVCKYNDPCANEMVCLKVDDLKKYLQIYEEGCLVWSK